MPKNKASDVHMFDSEEVALLLGDKVFGTLLSDEEVKSLSKSALADYKRYKKSVMMGAPNQ